jgi:hypothetical protein
MNPHYEKLADPTLMKLASHCSAKSPSENALYRRQLSEDASIDGATFLRDSKYWLVLSLVGRGLQSSTFQLNFSALYGIWVARRGCVARVKGVSGGV